MGRKKIVSYSFKEGVSQEIKLQDALTLFDLVGAANALPDIRKIAEREKLSFYDALESLLEHEMGKKEDLRIERWKKQAKFPRENTIEEYDFKVPEKIDEATVRQLASDYSWTNNGSNVIFLGPSGLGKTHLSIALGLKAIEQNYETRYMTIDKLTEAISLAANKDKQEEGSHNRKKLLYSMVNVPLLIVDEVALTDNVNSPLVADFLYQIIYNRHEKNKSMVLASNKKFDEWIPVFGGDKTRAHAAVDRILEAGIVISITGESYRMVKMRKQKTAKDKGTAA